MLKQIDFGKGDASASQRSVTVAIAIVAAAICLAVVAVVGAVRPTLAEDAAPTAPIFGQIILEGNPKNVAIESLGRVWYTLPGADKLALVTSDGLQSAAAQAVTYYAVEAGGQPYDLVVNNGVVWFTLLGTNKIGKLDIASGTVTATYPIPTANSEPTGITFGGNYVWFVERKGDKLGRLDPASGAIQEYPSLATGPSDPVDLSGAELEDVVYLNGDVWFTGPKLKASVVLYRTSNGKWIPSPAGSGAAPINIAADSQSNIWVTFSGTNRIGRSAINTLGNWDFYRLPAGTGGPAGLYVREANGVRELWYTRPEANRAGRLVTRLSGNAAVGPWETPLPVGNGTPWGIAADSNGTAWVAASDAAQAVTWNAPYFLSSLYMPQAACNSGPCVE